MKFALLAVILAIASAAPLIINDPAFRGERDWTNYKYAQYVTDFGKSIDASENTDRSLIFESNLAIINKHNADPAKTWFATVNGKVDTI